MHAPGDVQKSNSTCGPSDVQKYVTLGKNGSAADPITHNKIGEQRCLEGPGAASHGEE